MSSHVCFHLQRDHPDWGVLMFHYDVFCAYNIDAMRKTGMWDLYIPNYKAVRTFKLKSDTFDQYHLAQSLSC